MKGDPDNAEDHQIRPTNAFRGRGRNGYLPCYGIELTDMGNGDFAEILIHPIGSRGKASEACRIPIHKSAVPGLIEALNAMAGGERLFVRSGP